MNNDGTSGSERVSLGFLASSSADSIANDPLRGLLSFNQSLNFPYKLKSEATTESKNPELFVDRNVGSRRYSAGGGVLMGLASNEKIDDVEVSGLSIEHGVIGDHSLSNESESDGSDGSLKSNVGDGVVAERNTSSR